MLLVFWERIIKAIGICVALIIILIIIQKKINHRILFKGIVSLLSLLIVMGVFGWFGKYVKVEEANTNMYTKKELLQDYHQLREIVFSKSPLYYTDKPSLTEEFDKVEKSIDKDMTEDEFYRLINPLVTSIHCGHTNLYISKALQENRKQTASFFPIEVTYEDNNLIVNKDYIEEGISRGDIIQSINNKMSADIIETLIDNISYEGDNNSAANYILSRNFNIKYYDFIEQPKEFAVTFKKPDGKQYSRSLKSQYNSKYNVNAWDLHMQQYSDGDYYSYTINKDTAILRIKVFLKGSQPFDDFLKKFFSEVESKSIKRVTIDVRGNFGGDAKMSKELLSYLVPQKMYYFKSKLPFLMNVLGYNSEIVPKNLKYKFDTELLIDEGCFSTCGHFAAIYKSLGLGKVGGKPTGGGSLCTDGAKNATLRNTGIRFHYSTTIFEVNANLPQTNIVYPTVPAAQ